MTKGKFNEIWNIISDTAIAIENDTNGRAKFNITHKDVIHQHYEKLNALCKLHHMSKIRECPDGVSKTRHSEDFTLDRHKVASCMACALLRLRPIDVDSEVYDGTNLTYYANELLAFFVALSIMKSFTNRLLERKDNPDDLGDSTLSSVDTAILQGIVDDGYVFPDRGNHNDYLLWQLIALSNIGDFSDYVISFSCTLFLIEEYTIALYSSKLSSEDAK